MIDLTEIADVFSRHPGFREGEEKSVMRATAAHFARHNDPLATLGALASCAFVFARGVGEDNHESIASVLMLLSDLIGDKAMDMDKDAALMVRHARMAAVLGPDEADSILKHGIEDADEFFESTDIASEKTIEAVRKMIGDTT